MSSSILSRFGPLLIGLPMFVASASASARAQELFWQVDGKKLDRLGYQVSRTADVDGDGRSDVIVGASGNNVARLYSGASGALLREWTHVPPSEYFGRAVGDAGDVNGDGITDLVVGAPGDFAEAGDAYVYSGADGSELFHFSGTAAADQFGWSVCGIGDVNGDGHADVAIGAPALIWRLNFNERVEVRSGLDGSLLYAAFPSDFGELFGFDLARLDDLNGDGVSELAVAALDGEHVVVLNGKDGSQLLEIKGRGSVGEYFGMCVAKVGDFDGDGFGDLLIGAPGHAAAGAQNTGIAYVMSSVSGSLLQSFEGTTPGAGLGVSAADAGDANGDGVSDLLIGAPGAGSAELRSGRTGNLLYRFKSPPAQMLGTSVAGLGDLDGDGLGDLLLGAMEVSGGGGGSDRGRIAARRGNDLFLDSEPFAPVAGATLSLALAEGVAGNPAMIAVVDVNGTPTFQIVTLQPLDVNGLLQLSGTIPAGLGGTSVGLLGVVVAASGRLIRSDVETIAIQ